MLVIHPHFPKKEIMRDLRTFVVFHLLICLCSFGNIILIHAQDFDAYQCLHFMVQ